MTDLFEVLRRRTRANARQAVDVFADQVTEYRAPAGEERARASILEFGTFLRSRTLDCAASGHGLLADDLSVIGAAGAQRAAMRLSLSAQHRVVGVHTALMVRECYEAATPADTGDLLHLVGWLGREGPRARDAYFAGYLSSVERTWPVVARCRLLARMLLADEPPAAGAASPAERHLIVVARFGTPAPLSAEERGCAVADALAGLVVPVDWTDPGECLLLVPLPDADGDDDVLPDPVRTRTLALLAPLVAAAGRPCAVGTAVGRTGRMAGGLALARRISEVAPPQREPRWLHTLTDTFVELAVAGDTPVRDWLDAVAARLAGGPDLIRTLDAFYRHDMARAATATALRIHPRTLDYRIRRAGQLTGIDATSTRGVRVFTAAVARALGGRQTGTVDEMRTQ
ncbi:helix-turn-helix domain-containing protein [Jidongwangia harbinensis]|uniref:helix-turn-helix domain-containing protein n=1 Tax=Jidongwangia harbinensis TaxID=2878561 RepID=UPI001CDA04D7|nr:helix-turn-helix domain-containing protein [Jidongwangia harbinensis]MCA2218243.1 helix-turn-helix domain-containing protein [Jidongwangia harbinensis]